MRARSTSHYAIVSSLGTALALFCSAPAGAQAPVNASLAVQATVVTPLTVTVSRMLEFGTILTGTNKSVVANGSAGARFDVAGSAGTAIAISITMPATLNGPSGGTLPVSGWHYMTSDTPTLPATGAITFGGGSPAAVNATLSGATGTAHVYFGIGATAMAGASIPGGVYTGVGTITASYADL